MNFYARKFVHATYNGVIGRIFFFFLEQNFYTLVRRNQSLGSVENFLYLLGWLGNLLLRL
jgi:hypothetical protein